METLNKKEIIQFFSNKTFKIVVVSLASLIVLIGVFSLGVNVGFHQARFFAGWEQGYPANFGAPGTEVIKPGGPGPDRQMFGGHGISGIILSNDNGVLTIKDEDSDEKTVIASSTATAIRQNFTDLKITDLKPNDSIVVIGAPNDQGQIEAKFIRVLN